MVAVSIGGKGEMGRQVQGFGLFPHANAVTDLLMDANAEILKVGYREGYGPVLWAIVDKDATVMERKFLTIFTGKNCDEYEISIHNYIGTYTNMVGKICHVFEVTPSKPGASEK